MSRTFGTKKRIMKLLGGRAMNITEISTKLGLSKATVSQHISELERMSLIEQISNEHYKKVKYYRLSGKSLEPITSAAEKNSLHRFLIPSILVVVIAAAVIGFFLFGQRPASTGPAIMPAGPGTASACPMMIAYINGTHPNYTALNSMVQGIAAGSPCSLAYVNTTLHEIAALKYASQNGTVSVPFLNYTYSISANSTTALENGVNEGYCSDEKALVFFGINYPEPSGVSCKTQIYG